MSDFIIESEHANSRVDSVAIAYMPKLSRSFVKKLIITKKILVNGKRAKPNQKLKTGDALKVDFDPSDFVYDTINIPVIYEDKGCLVLDKPVGVLTHSKGAFNPEATVATFIKPQITSMSGERAGIVHRLDRATSGVMICAKNKETLSWLQKQFSLRKVKKTYIAVVSGELKDKHAIIDMPIARNPKKPQTFRVDPNGKPAITEYKVIDTGNGLSLLELKPQTGRTHQLRVHLKHLGHPILGDSLYGGQKADRLYLHACKLEITLPNGERKIFSAKLPTRFRRTIKKHD